MCVLFTWPKTGGGHVCEITFQELWVQGLGWQLTAGHIHHSDTNSHLWTIWQLEDRLKSPANLHRSSS